jgi:transposase InsO family protein
VSLISWIGTPLLLVIEIAVWRPARACQWPIPAFLIKRRGPWRSLADVELATAEYIDWYNTRGLHTAIGGVPPAEYEAAYHAQTQPQQVPTTEASTKPGTIQTRSSRPDGT